MKIAVITIIEADNALFLILSCNLFTNGFSAAANTNDANNIINNPYILGIKNSINIASMVNIIVFTLKNFFSIHISLENHAEFTFQPIFYYQQTKKY